MRARGKVLREPNSGPGLLMIDGQQFRFALDGIWRSDTVPKRGLDVLVELDNNLQLTGITAVPEHEIARDRGEGGVSVSQYRPGQTAPTGVVEFGAAPFLATLLLLFGWFFLTTLSIAVPFAGKVNLTFWQLLGIVNASDALDVVDRSASQSPGIYSLASAVVLTGPFLHHFWKDRRVYLGGLAPLVFTIVMWITARTRVQQAIVANLTVPRVHGATEFGSTQLSFEFGFYFSAFISLYFAGLAVWRFLRGRVAETRAG